MKTKTRRVSVSLPECIDFALSIVPRIFRLHPDGLIYGEPTSEAKPAPRDQWYIRGAIEEGILAMNAYAEEHGIMPGEFRFEVVPGERRFIAASKQFEQIDKILETAKEAQ